MGSINNLFSNSYVQSLISGAVQGTGLTNKTTQDLASISSGAQGDIGQLSPFAQILSSLQQLQQENPTQYRQVTEQIAVNLQNAAKKAEANGNTNAARQLGQLATDFSDASKSGQLPKIQDLAQAAGGHHRHHGHKIHGLPTADTDTAADPASASAASSSPASIILGTLLSAGSSSAGSSGS